MLVIFEAAPVEKCVFFPAMAVQIDVNQNFSLLVHMLYKVFCVKNWRVQKAIRFFPVSVQVDAEEAAAVIPVNYAIGVEHWHNSDHEVLSEHFGLR